MAHTTERMSPLPTRTERQARDGMSRRHRYRPAARRRLAVIAACGMLMSCTAPPADIAVRTDPPGAHCDVLQGGKVVTAVNATPGRLHLKSTYPDFTVYCRHAGFRDAQFTPEWSPGNVLIGGPPGRAVDASLGFDYSAPITIRLQTLARPR